MYDYFLFYNFSDPFARRTFSRLGQPIDSLRLLKSFLLVCKRFERFKRRWGEERLGVECINTPTLYNTFW